MFESRLHWRNTWIEDFSKEIESNDYSIVLKPKYRELYLEIHQYKNTFVKHIQLFDSSLRFCVYIMRGLIGIFVWTTTIFRKKKKKKILDIFEFNEMKKIVYYQSIKRNITHFNRLGGDLDWRGSLGDKMQLTVIIFCTLSHFFVLTKKFLEKKFSLKILHSRNGKKLKHEVSKVTI